MSFIIGYIIGSVVGIIFLILLMNFINWLGDRFHKKQKSQ